MLVELLCLFVPALTGAQTKAVPGDLTVGITLNCPYGLGVCYPEIHSGLSRVPGLKWLADQADPNTWTCKLRMADEKLLRPKQFSAYLDSLHAGATLRGIEATVAGHIAIENGRYFLVARNTWLPLRQLSHTAFWDVAKKRSQSIAAPEKQAFSKLVAGVAEGDKLVVAGPLTDQKGEEVPALEVRSFREWQTSGQDAEFDLQSGDLFATISVQQPLSEKPRIRPIEDATLPPPSEIGSWSAPLESPGGAVHAHLMPNGRVAFSGTDAVVRQYTTEGKIASLTTAPYNVFCGGHTQMADGRVFFAGGNGPSIGCGDSRAAIYDPVQNQWTQLPSMGALRWYPTVVQLPNNRILVFSGQVSGDSGNLIPQVWSPTGWVNLTGARRVLERYPNTYVAPDARVFVAGPDQQSMYLNTGGVGSWDTGPMRNFAYRDYGPTVMYEPGKILYVGGGSPPTATTETIDLNASHPAWTNAAPMSYPRRQCSATVLPDGTVFVNGGTYSSLFDDPTKPVLQSELWDPATNSWSPMASQQRYRGYHSTSILLLDGTVFTASGAGDCSVENFSPPYLFKGPRPQIIGAPTQIVSGKPFKVTSPNAEKISKVSLIRLSSATHTLNHDQQFQWLNFTRDKSSLTIDAPMMTPVTAPGLYILFILNGKGVPSIGRVVQFERGNGLPPHSDGA